MFPIPLELVKRNKTKPNPKGSLQKPFPLYVARLTLAVLSSLFVPDSAALRTLSWFNPDLCEVRGSAAPFFVNYVFVTVISTS